MENCYLSVDYHSSIDLESEFISCYAKFKLINMGTDEETEIGSASLYFINSFLKNDWSEVVDAADSISGDMCTIVYQLTDILEEELDFFGHLAILDRIKIKEEYREMGYGTEALSEIVRYLEILSIDYLALIPSPFEQDDDKKQIGLRRLVEFYEKFQLKIVNKKDESELIMGRNLNCKR